MIMRTVLVVLVCNGGADDQEGAIQFKLGVDYSVRVITRQI